jgi:hypothetical protein
MKTSFGEISSLNRVAEVFLPQLIRTLIVEDEAIIELKFNVSCKT